LVKKAKKYLSGGIVMNNIFNEDGLVPKKSLNNVELKGIEELETICNRYDNLNMRLNWKTMRERSLDEENDFLYFEDGLLVGYLGMYSFNDLTTEVSGMVHPDYRNMGIFTKLYSTAKEKCKERQIEKMILICEKSSNTGKHFLKSIGANYYSTEYKMEFKKQKIKAKKEYKIKIRKAKIEDASVRADIIRQCFNTELKPQVFTRGLNDKDQYRYVCEIENKVIGNISASRTNGNINIYGIGIFEEYRGKGYGREMLMLFLEQLMKEQDDNIFLEVACDNDNALSLYKSCGFNEVTGYDYYEITLDK